MARKTLDQLKDMEAKARADVAAAQRRLRTINQRERALKVAAARERWMAAGRLVEELGLPMNPDVLRPLLLLLDEHAVAGMAPCDPVLSR